MKGDRRAVFFLISAVVCALLMFVADAPYRWIVEATAITYLVLAAASAFDARSRSKS